MLGFFVGKTLLVKQQEKPTAFFDFLWHSILQNEITKSEKSSTAKWKVVSLQK